MNQNLKELIEYPKSGILSKSLVKGENVTLFCMAKDGCMEEHTSTKKGFIYVLEGQGIFTLEDKKIKMEAGKFIFMGKNAVHSLKASKKTSFILILTK